MNSRHASFYPHNHSFPPVNLGNQMEEQWLKPSHLTFKSKKKPKIRIKTQVLYMQAKDNISVQGWEMKNKISWSADML